MLLNYSRVRRRVFYFFLRVAVGGWGENRGVLSLAEAARMAVGWRLAGGWLALAWSLQGACFDFTVCLS